MCYYIHIKNQEYTFPVNYKSPGSAYPTYRTRNLEHPETPDVTFTTTF